MRRVASVAASSAGASSSSLLLASGSGNGDVSLYETNRRQSTDQFHRFLHNPKIVQPDGVDSLHVTKQEQQMWLNTEQWCGYSDTYLQRFMQYPAQIEHPNPNLTVKNPHLDACLAKVYQLYGPVAERVQTLHDDPLHPRFHEVLAQAKKDREHMAEAIDKVYATLHPTVKTVWDAFMVRRYYQLGDWIAHVEMKRKRLFERMSPEYIDQMVKSKGLAEHYIHRLTLLRNAMNEDPAIMLLSADRDYTEEEVAMIRQKASYYRNMRRFGLSYGGEDLKPR